MRLKESNPWDGRPQQLERPPEQFLQRPHCGFFGQIGSLRLLTVLRRVSFADSAMTLSQVSLVIIVMVR